MKRLLLLTLLPLTLLAEPCKNVHELTNKDYMGIGVRFPKALNPYAFINAVRALDWWATVLNMDWTVDQSDNCTIELKPHIWKRFQAGVQIGGAVILGDDGFDGILEFNPTTHYAINLLFMHELGHIFGLEHNEDQRSIMYPASNESGGQLLAEDLKELSKNHKLR